MNVNPDNVATPIAASLGDLVTLAILAYASSSIHDLYLVDNSWINEHSLDLLDHASLGIMQENGISLGSLCCITLMVLYYIAIMPTCYMMSKQCKETEIVLFEGWTPGNLYSLEYALCFPMISNLIHSSYIIMRFIPIFIK